MRYIKEKDFKDKYNWVTVLGAFDHLHEGHKHIIKRAFDFGNNVIVGIIKNRGAVPWGGEARDIGYAEEYSKRFDNFKAYTDSLKKPYVLKEYNNEMSAGLDLCKRRMMGEFDAYVMSSKDMVNKHFAKLIEYFLKNFKALGDVVIVEALKDENGRDYSSGDIRYREYLKEKYPNVPI